MMKLKNILAMLMCVLILASAFAGCRPKQEPETEATEPTTEEVTETETDAPEEKGDPTYGYFEDDEFGWTEYGASAPEVSFYINEAGALFAVRDGAAKNIYSAVRSINGIMSKSIFITTETGLLNAIDYDGSVIKTICTDAIGGAALNPHEMIIYYGQGEAPISVCGYNLKADNETVVYTDTKIYSGVNEADSPFVFAMNLELGYKRGAGVSGILYYPYGSEFPYERYMQFETCSVKYDDHEHTDQNGMPPERVDETYIFDKGEPKYLYSARLGNGYIIANTVIPLSADGSVRGQKVEFPSATDFSILSHAMAGGKLFCVTVDYSAGNSSLWKLEGGSDSFTLVKEGTQVEQVFSYNDKLYALAFDDNRYVIYGLDGEGRYESTLWTAPETYSADYNVEVDSLGQYAVIHDIEYSLSDSHLKRVEAVLDLKTGNTVA